MGRYHQGKYKPINVDKIIGDPTKITYRSSWERRVMHKLDRAEYVLRWGSECLYVPYRSPKDGRIHRYFPDFLVVSANKYGDGVVTTLIEVKPYKEQFMPTKRGKKHERYIQECITYSVNQAKWEAAKKLCDNKGWKWAVMTEKQILG